MLVMPYPGNKPRNVSLMDSIHIEQIHFVVPLDMKVLGPIQ